jgi:hypothetical protein
VLSHILILAPKFSLQTFAMMPDSSAASTSAESTDDFSVGRDGTSTPATSPVFSTRHDSILETLGNFTDLGLAAESSQNGVRQRLPDMLDPATAAGIEVKNVCFVGAGYVGKSEIEKAVFLEVARDARLILVPHHGGVMLSIVYLTPRVDRCPNCCSDCTAKSHTPRYSC